MIFAESTLKQADAAFECHSRPPSHVIEVFRTVFFLEKSDCFIDVFDDLFHNEVAGIPGFIESRIIGSRNVVKPRNISETFHHIEIVVCPEKFGNTGIFPHSCRIRAIADILKQEVDMPESFERPASALFRNGTCETNLTRKRNPNHIVTDFLVYSVSSRENIAIEPVCIKFQLRFVLEICLHSHSSLWREIQKIAGAQQC